MTTHQITTQLVSSGTTLKIFSRFNETCRKQQIAGLALFKFLELQTIHTENLASLIWSSISPVSGDTTYNIGRMGRENQRSERFCNSLANGSEG